MGSESTTRCLSISLPLFTIHIHVYTPLQSSLSLYPLPPSLLAPLSFSLSLPFPLFEREKNRVLAKKIENPTERRKGEKKGARGKGRRKKRKRRR